MKAKDEILKIVGQDYIEAISVNKEGVSQYFDKGAIEVGLKSLNFDLKEPPGVENEWYLYVWTKHKVIFKVIYDGTEMLDWVPRNPDRNIPTRSIGIT